jgi:hypothetical protein
MFNTCVRLIVNGVWSLQGAERRGSPQTPVGASRQEDHVTAERGAARVPDRRDQAARRQ